MTQRAFIAFAVGALLAAIVGSAIITNKVQCNRGIKGRQSLIAMREGFIASAHGRYQKAALQANPRIAAEERAEGAGLYRFARRITVKPPNCGGLYPIH